MNIKKNILVVISTLLIQHSTIVAQNGVLDTSFNSTGIVTLDINNSNDVMKSITTQSDGKIIVAGYTSNSVSDSFCIVRFNSNGSIDNTFGTNGIVVTNFQYTSVCSALTLQNDGKILVAGHTWNGTENQFAVARYTTNGVLDSTFGNQGKVLSAFVNKNAVAKSMSIQNDGKIIVAGHTYTTDSDFDEFALARYNANGIPDNTFGTAGQITTSFGAGTKNWINSIKIQTDGKIIAGGFSNNNFALARYNSSGSLDTSFGNNGLVSSIIPNTNSGLINAIAIHSDGSIFGAGFSVDAFSNFTIVKYDTFGNIDNNFGQNGVLISQISAQQDGIKDIKIQSDNKLLVGGFTSENSVFQFALARYDILGNLDTTFGNNGVVKTLISTNYNHLNAISIQPDGKILAAGYVGFNTPDIALARYSAELLPIEEHVLMSEEFSVYPNPTNNKLYITFKTKNIEDTTFKLYDNQGRLIDDKLIANLYIHNTYTEVFDLTSYPNGVYFLNISIKDGGVKNFKIVKNK